LGSESSLLLGLPYGLVDYVNPDNFIDKGVLNPLASHFYPNFFEILFFEWLARFFSSKNYHDFCSAGVLEAL
jgi:hypothetical protein